MQLTTYLTALTLLALSTSTLAAVVHPRSVSPDLMVSNDYHNGWTCGLKNPLVNIAISAFCNGPNNGANDFASNTPWALHGMKHDGYTVRVVDHGCPASSTWIPEQFCLGQFHYLCAEVGAGDGVGTAWFGEKWCQEWRVEGDGSWGA